MSLSDEYLEFYGKVNDIFNGCNTLSIAIERLKELIEEQEK